MSFAWSRLAPDEPARLHASEPVQSPRPWSQRRAGECAFPVGEPARPDEQLSCCAPVGGPGPYCAAHTAGMWEPGTAFTREEMDTIVSIDRRSR
jgi:hypothetical protein